MFCRGCFNYIGHCDCVNKHYELLGFDNEDNQDPGESIPKDKGQCLRFYHPTEPSVFSVGPPQFSPFAQEPIKGNPPKRSILNRYDYQHSEHQWTKGVGKGYQPDIYQRPWPSVQYNPVLRKRQFYSAEVICQYEDGSEQAHVYYFKDKYPTFDDISNAIAMNLPFMVFPDWNTRNEYEQLGLFDQGLYGRKPSDTNRPNDPNWQPVPPEGMWPPGEGSNTDDVNNAPEDPVEEEHREGGKPLTTPNPIFNPLPNQAIPIGLVAQYVFDRPTQSLTAAISAVNLQTIRVQYSQPTPAGNNQPIIPTRCEIICPPHVAGNDVQYQPHWLIFVCTDNFATEQVTISLVREQGLNIICQVNNTPEFFVGTSWTGTYFGKNKGINYIPFNIRSAAQGNNTVYRVTVTGNWDPNTKFINTDVGKGFISKDGLPPSYSPTPSGGQKFIFSGGTNQNRRYLMTIPPTLPEKRFPDIMYALNSPYVGINDGNCVRNNFHGPSGEGKYRLVFLTSPGIVTPEQVYEVGHISGAFGEIYGVVRNN